MNIIFLDIDGVMNCQTFYEARHKKFSRKLRRVYFGILSYIRWIRTGSRYYTFRLTGEINTKWKEYKSVYKKLRRETCNMRWEWLIELVKDTNASICISSVWRSHFENVDDWGRALDEIGFPKNTFIGITKHLGKLRGDEIKEFLDVRNNLLKKYKSIQSINYAIIDDDSDMLKEQLPNFFQTDAYSGLTPNICYQIKQNFNKN